MAEFHEITGSLPTHRPAARYERYPLEHHGKLQDRDHSVTSG